MLVAGIRAWIGLAAIVTAQGAPGVVGDVLTAAGFVVLGYTVFLVRYLSTLRLEVRPGELRLRSVFGERRFRLTSGAVMRRRLRHAWLSPVEATVGGFGVRLGEGQLGMERLVSIIALDRSQALIMVPVVGGRVAVAPASDDELLAALAAATRSAPSSPGLQKT